MSDRATSTARLTTSQVAGAMTLARSTHLAYARKAGAYGHNSLAMHEIGKLGEFGAADWFEIRGYIVHRRFGGANAEADIHAEANGRMLRIEVKTWSTDSWARNGRMVSGKQLDSIVTKADVIVWCRIPEASERREVILEGWSPVSDLLQFGSPLWWPNYLPQLQLEDRQLRPIGDLSDPKRAPELPQVATAQPHSPCGHTRHHGICWSCVPMVDAEQPDRVRIATDRSYFHHGVTATLKERHGYWPFGDLPELVPLYEAALRRVSPCPTCFPLKSDNVD